MRTHRFEPSATLSRDRRAQRARRVSASGANPSHRASPHRKRQSAVTGDFLRSTVGGLPSPRFVDLTALHPEHNVLQQADIFKWVAIHGDDVSEVTGGHGPGVPDPPE